MKKIGKILSAALISLGLFSIPVQAGTWIPHEGVYNSYLGKTVPTSWEYIKDDGTHAEGWEYINWKWYYFDYEDGVAATGLKTIDGKDYFFDPINCDMKHDQYVKVGSGRMGVYNWASSSGAIDYNYVWCPNVE